MTVSTLVLLPWPHGEPTCNAASAVARTTPVSPGSAVGTRWLVTLLTLPDCASLRLPAVDLEWESALPLTSRANFAVQPQYSFQTVLLRLSTLHHKADVSLSSIPFAIV